MNTDWDNLMDCDLDKATENFADALMATTKASIPQKTFSTKSNNKPWFNLELMRQIRKRDRLFFIAKDVTLHMTGIDGKHKKILQQRQINY